MCGKAAPTAASVPDIPSEPFGFMHRQRLSYAFSIAMQRYPIVVLTAPNGYGKTTFLAHELRGGDRPVAWVEIDGRFAVHDVFTRAFCRAIERAHPRLGDVGRRFQNLCEEDLGPREYEKLVEAIADQVPRLCIVLDGYESVESDQVDGFVNYLMEYLPETARLVIATSRKPHLDLNRMALRGRLLELRTIDFAFTFQEASGLLNDMLGLGLSFGEVERINEHMDGWVGGLRMAEVALRSGTDLEVALSSAGELQRTISQYLSDDIVNRQEDGLRTFLLESCIFEEFCAELCDVALQRSDSAPAIMKLLERKLFLQPAAKAGWYRYANFFRVCLQDLAEQLPKEAVESNHSRASIWLEEHGLTEQALRHAIEAGDYDRVSAVLSSNFGSAMGHDGAARMNELMGRLPESIVRKSRWANISAAIACEMRQCFAEEGVFVQAVLGTPEEMGSEGDAAFGGACEGDAPPNSMAKAVSDGIGSVGQQGATLAASLHIVSMLHDYHHDRAADAVMRGEELLKNPDELGQHGKCGVLNVMGLCHWYLGDVSQAQACWQESGNLATYIDWPYSICLNLFGVAHAHYVCGRYESAQETCERVFAISNQQEAPVLSSGYAHMLMAKIHYDRNELELAANEVRTARRIAHAGKERVLAMNAEMAIARIELAQGRRKDAVDLANRTLSHFCSDLRYRQSFDEANMLMAQVWLLAGKPDLAVGYLGRFAGFDVAVPFDEEQGCMRLKRDVFGSDFRTVWCEEPLFDHLFGLIQEGRTEGVVDWADYVRREAGARGMALVVTKALVVKALCAHREDKVDEALGWLAEALQLAEQNGSCRLFADGGRPVLELLQTAKRKQLASRFANQVMTLITSESDISVAARGDFGQEFTRREREIMQLLCQGATNDEISKRLFLSLSTVKNHIHHIYTKLGVRNRAEAIVRMREMNEAG